MVKKILLTVLLTVLSVGLLVGYFYHIDRYAGAKRQNIRCEKVSIIVLDSLESDIVNKSELEKAIKKQCVGIITDSIDLHALEFLLDNNGEISESQVFWKDEGLLGVTLTQRKPVVRLEMAGGGYYSDSEGYLFPVQHPIDVPVITGSLPLNLESGYRGYADSTSMKWLKAISGMASYISSDKYWNRQIAQIDVEKNSDIVLYLSSGDLKVIFGDASDYIDKLDKLEQYYRYIAPLEKAQNYTTVNLKYRNQIICK